ncbi:hypothetical protein [Nocardioides sp. Leaf285]|uniref:hypothetical protein n=1 Tax=Nocardioides sp. Leaf285 TaxID=1736322 RepID=UPI00070307AD|nr:hypothetical protein [Nocardioides sp. Leaf285]KQP62922.1 hypothetical protein ASF47_18085 [Nocardioides sp. Leaf285]
MSVTFAPAFRESDVAGFGFFCACGAANTGVLAATYPACEALRGGEASMTVRCGDEYCDADRAADGSGFIMTINGVEIPEINVSSLNAGHLIDDVLGIERDFTHCSAGLVGAMSAEQFLGRVLMAMAIQPSDAGVPAHAVGGPGATWINCGREPGYDQRVLSHLHEVATWAAANGRDVHWG